jgi:hypothetical protein
MKVIMKKLSSVRYLFLFVFSILFTFGCNWEDSVYVNVVDIPDNNSINEFYFSNRAPLMPSVLIKLPIISIQPEGWLLEYIKRQRNGLTGHLGKISAWLQKEDNAWLSEDGKGKWGWEEVPYWLRGYSKIGYILRDEAIISEAMIWIEGALNCQHSNGDFGPEFRFKNGYRDYWPNMIMLFCLQSYYEYSADERVLDLMTRYFKHQSTIPDEEMFSGYWDKMRGGDNLHSVYWLYNRTGDTFLLALAEKIHRNTENWKMIDTLPNWHNVNVAQCFNEPAVYYQQSGDSTDLRAAYDNFTIIRELYGQMPGGMYAADENAREGYDDPHQCVETCGMVEHMLSDEQLLSITGDVFWADHCEEVAFNSYPAAVMPDFRSLRYLTGANQVLSDKFNRSPAIQNGGPFFVMNPFSSRCCQHNHSHGWPYYVEHLWYATPDNGLAAVLYSASTITAKVGSGAEVSIEQKTNYPFDESIEFIVKTDKPAKFPVYLRVPGWCRNSKVSLNKKNLSVIAKPGQYIRIKKEWENGDKIVLELPMEISLRQWDKNHNSVSVNLGPLTYSLKIGEDYKKLSSDKSAIFDSRWQKGADTSKWPAWEIYPTTPWNYGLIYDRQNPSSSFNIVKTDWPDDNMPFRHEGVPVKLIAKGKQIPEWKLDEFKLAGELQDSPVKSDEKVESITLIPMGAARLRISAFPVIGEGNDARHWK